MKKPKKDLWAMMSPDAAQLLKEALAKTDEDVADSLIAHGCDLEKLDAELIALVNRLPPRRKTTRGFVGRSVAVASALGAVGAAVYGAVVAIAPAEAVSTVLTAAAAAAPPANDTVAADADADVDAGKPDGGVR